MDLDKHLLHQRYRDGELSQTEEKTLLQGLPASKQDELQAENELEQRLVEKIHSTTETCPDELWQQLTSKMTQRTPRRIPLWSAVAALFIIAVGLLWFSLPLQKAVGQVQIEVPKTMDEFMTRATVKGNRQEVQEFLHQHGFAIDLQDIDECGRKHGHGIEMVGVHIEHAGEKQAYAEVYTLCCTCGVYTCIAQQSLTMDIKTDQPNMQQTQQDVGAYRIVTLSDHPTEPVADLFEQSL